MQMKKPSMNNTTLPSLAEGGGEGRGIRVLVAEDERDTLMTLGILLRSEDFEVVMLSDGREVLTEVQRFQPHAVILDIGMPGRNGYDVARDVRAACGAASPVLIAVTAYDGEADKLRAQLSGFQHHVAKPFDPVRLLELLAAVRGGVIGN
jgi:CheY-like chemotaxis protein